MQKWLDIKGYEGLYQISNDGKVKSLPRQFGSIFRKKSIILKPKTDRYNYQAVHLSKDNKKSWPTVHRLVAEAFIPNPENKRMVNHKDGNKQNCCSDNLEWVTNDENVAHAVATGLVNNKGISNPKNKLSESDVVEIRKLRNNGYKCNEIAKMFNVNDRSISNITLRKSWVHI